ncbi:hypothetical protein AKJ62_02665 [candidate division MSBL1 archaeon SCGC-AAA259D14]|uniref:Transposase IS4-like domain-containing protein n=1 Tax=candidate division MSBL1 archaeon SCGC-AAA259D14 TaxID=1698261 RepID=A0A133U625_9EURY|nr:hypothetical protein AKJ62_02665 [candidate division MSBL1 archaeon SCGC-AAA259D14]
MNESFLDEKFINFHPFDFSFGMKSENVEKLNEGEFDEDILFDFTLSFAEEVREKIIQRFYRNEAGKEEKRFAEFVLVELVRALLRMPPATFYLFLRNDRELRNVLDLKTIGNYDDFDKKRKYLKMHLDRILKRNLDTENGDIYILDLTVAESDVNKFRKGKDLKEGILDAEFIHSTTKGTVTGFQVAYLINLSKLSFEKLKIYSKHAAKKRIWKEMVIDKLGTKQEKIKTVIGDAGFFAYRNYLDSCRSRLIPVIKTRSDLEEKTLEKIEKCASNLTWFGKRYQSQLKDLLGEFEEILETTIDRVKECDGYAGLRSEIEHIFKTAKMIFGMNDMHVYNRKHCHWKAFLTLYMSSLLLQFLKINKINKNRAIPLLAQKRHLW